ncbi:MAG: urea ABC transporter permease subunit UrtC [Ruminococcus sp.]|jgi:urea transport system permease protein
MGARLKNITVEKWTALVLFVVLAILPMTTSLYTTQTFGKFISYMILALALDLLWGGAGLMNLGFAVFFGLGGYIVGISLASQEGLPYFMKSAGMTELPFFYKPLASPAVAVVLSILIPALLALFLGYFIFTSKIKGVFFNIITLAFAALFELFIANQQAYTGGSSGINGIATGLSDITFFGHPISIQGWYYIALAALILVYLFCLWLLNGRFGKVINSVRDNEARLQFLGYNPAKFKMAVFAIAGALAGFAGALYIPMTSFISVDSAGVTFSTTILVWLAVGGRGNLTGAMIGALLVNILSSQFSSNFGEMWQLILGVVLIVMVLFLPKGIMGSLMDVQYNRRIHKKHLARSREE